MNIIVAQIENGIIATDGDLPWKNVLTCTDIAKRDMTFFKEMTTGCDIVMGWNTWVSIGQRPFKNRGTHYIITSKDIVSFRPDVVFINFDSFIKLLPSIDSDDLWCVGGAKLYKALKKYSSKIYISILKPAIPIKTDGRNLTYLNFLFQESENFKGNIVLNKEFPATKNKIIIWEYIQEPFHNPQR